MGHLNVRHWPFPLVTEQPRPNELSRSLLVVVGERHVAPAVPDTQEPDAPERGARDDVGAYARDELSVRRWVRATRATAVGERLPRGQDLGVFTHATLVSMTKPLTVLIAFLLTAGAAGGITLEPEPLQTCPSGQGSTVVKTTGICSGTSCPMACKRTSCAPNLWWARKTQLNPLCNPVTGANCDTQTLWRYEVRTNVSATNACPSAINTAAYQAP